MAGYRLPSHLFGGRVRTSTVVLALVFLIALATYLLVRPVPASVARTQVPSSPTATSGPSKSVRPSSRSPAPTTPPAQTSAPAAPPSRGPSPTPTPVPSAPPVSTPPSPER